MGQKKKEKRNLWLHPGLMSSLPFQSISWHGCKAIEISYSATITKKV